MNSGTELGRVPLRKRIKSPTHKDDSDEEDDGFTMSNMGNYFRQTYDTLSGYLPVMPLVGEEDKNTKPKRRYRVKLQRGSNGTNGKSPKGVRHDIKDKDNRWYDKFFFGSVDEDEPATEAPAVVTPSEDSGFFSWFAENGDKSAETTNATQDASQQGGVDSTQFPFVIRFERLNYLFY